MEAKAVSILDLFRGKTFFVPKYQRAYSWDSPTDINDKEGHTAVFITDLEDYISSKTTTPYYFGHFLFEKKDDKNLNIIDGQQRLTTIVIFLSELIRALESVSELTDDELEIKEEIIQKRSKIHFSTVDYDNQFFIDYVIKGAQNEKYKLNTSSKKRIQNASNFFKNYLTKKVASADSYRKLLSCVTSAACTTHQVDDEAFAIQMFIFQNNRGKKPTNLEVIKAQFMYHAHLYGGEAASTTINEIKNRFEEIYISIATIEYNIHEDSVLLYTLRVFFNSLWESNSIEKVNLKLNESKDCNFILDFSKELSRSFESLQEFFNEDGKKHFNIHSLITLGGIGFAIPFILKAYKYNLEKNEIGKLCKALESILLRDKLIGTRADITARMSHGFAAFTIQNKDINPILERIDCLKTATDYYWGHWRTSYLVQSIQGNVKKSIARFILWKYENYLLSKDKKGYSLFYNQIEKPEVEHIAPSTEPESKPHGYPNYDQQFINEYLNCLGNWLLISKSHNCSIHNDVLTAKLTDYNHLKQQNEIREMVNESGGDNWSKELIEVRKNKIIEFVKDTF